MGIKELFQSESHSEDLLFTLKKLHKILARRFALQGERITRQSFAFLKAVYALVIFIVIATFLFPITPTETLTVPLLLATLRYQRHGAGWVIRFHGFMEFPNQRNPSLRDSRLKSSSCKSFFPDTWNWKNGEIKKSDNRQVRGRFH
jgi:hypothetical protein